MRSNSQPLGCQSSVLPLSQNPRHVLQTGWAYEKQAYVAHCLGNCVSQVLVSEWLLPHMSQLWGTSELYKMKCLAKINTEKKCATPSGARTHDHRIIGCVVLWCTGWTIRDGSGWKDMRGCAKQNSTKKVADKSKSHVIKHLLKGKLISRIH